MKLHQRFLRLFDPKGESDRRDYRETAALAMAEVEDLNKTISMKSSNFIAMMQNSREHELTIVANGASKTVEFITFAEICRFHYSPKDSLMSLCKNPKHEAAQSGIAPCQRAVCPFYTERK